MAVQLDYEFLPSANHVTILWALPNAFANWEYPTAAELNASLNMSRSISWNDFDLGVQASNTSNDPSLADVGNVETRGAAQFGGGISFFYPREYDDNSNNHSVVFDAVGQPRTRGYIVIRIDGDKPTTQAFASGDYVHVMEVMTDGETNVITGEEAFRYTINFLQQGNLAVYTVVGSGAATVVTTPATLTPAPGDVGRIRATVNGREFTGGVAWSTDDPDVVTINSNGVYTVTGADTDTATITATFEASGATDTTTVTVTA